MELEQNLDEIFKKGEYYVFSVPPGWIFTGQVEKVGARITLKNATWMERSDPPFVQLSERTAKAAKIVSEAHPVEGKLYLLEATITSHFSISSQVGEDLYYLSSRKKISGK